MHAYSTNENRLRTYGALAGLAVVLAYVSHAVLEASGVGPAWLVSSPVVAGSYALLYRFVDYRAWRWQWLRPPGLIETPVVDGVYEGELVSSYEGKVVPIRITVSQRWTALAVRLETLGPATSTSYSIAAALTTAGHQDARLSYTYKNEISPGVADADMSDHDGTADLFFDRAADAFTGRYFNARGRQGAMTLTRVV